MKAWEIVSDSGINGLSLGERDDPIPGPNEVLLAVKASSLNYRDLSTILNPSVRNISYPRIPNSDCAGEILSVGCDVTSFKSGDRVMGCFFQQWASGDISSIAMNSALGGPIDGVLCEKVVLKASSIIAVPDHLTLEEASTLPCAAVTAWNALVEFNKVKPGDTVLLLGTGGVSIFSQQFCNILGANTIVTSSDDEKLKKIKKIGANDVINYESRVDWDKAVIELTQNTGVDHVIEVGGAGTLQKSIITSKIGGNITLIGVLTGTMGTIIPTDIMRKSITLRGIYVGSRQIFLEMSKAISYHKLRPIIDSTFDFDDAQSAFKYMKKGEHFGKIVIRI